MYIKRKIEDDILRYLKADVKNVFLNGGFSVTAIYKSGTQIKQIQVQHFNEALDKMGTLYDHVWCSFEDIPYVKDNDTLEISGTVYGIIDNTPDEQNVGMNLFLNKVTN